MPFFGYSFCFSCKYSSKIPSNCFVVLFALMLSFSDSKVEISSVFNDANRLKAILFTFQKHAVIFSKLPTVLRAWVRQRAIILCFGPKFGHINIVISTKCML